MYDEMVEYLVEFHQNYISRQHIEDKTFSSLVAGVTFEQQVAVLSTKFSIRALFITEYTPVKFSSGTKCLDQGKRRCLNPAQVIFDK